jgi:hypothetical protein
MKKSLSNLVQNTLKKFPILKNLYDETFLDNLLNKRFYYDNFLLWLLASEEPYAHETLADISRNLEILKDSDGITHFKKKLRSHSEPILKSYLTELEFAAYYREKGCEVELEPKIPESDKAQSLKSYLKILKFTLRQKIYSEKK